MFPFPPDAAPLSGVRVLDAARVLAGPFCGQLLADLGGDVVKLERPGTGDDTRDWGPPFTPDGLSAYFLSCNRSKRSLTLDIASPEGNDIFHRLLAKSDVLIENFRTDSAEKLGLTPEKLLARHPRLIVSSISGFGRTGPLRDAPGYDFAIQAMSGLMSITGPTEGPPCKVGVAVADVLTGLYAATAILACLHARQRSGHGYAIDLALLDCALASQVNVAQAYLTSGRVPERQGNSHLQIVPYQLFETADGWLVLNVGNDGQWKAFCEAAGAAELGADPRFATNRQRVERRDEVVPRVAALMKSLPTAEWEKRLAGANVPHAVVWNYADVFAQPQTAARGMKLTVRDPAGNPVDLVGNPVRLAGGTLPAPTMPPRLGEQTQTVLGELLGLDPSAVARLREKGVV
ncbi:MAG TPA: CaiB/BaiF CoA-transferase family protein [Gemmataceae bacterium]|nr:CaiB/BaiF CoA-transferase family protein [Gemmataceae bacterium]